MSEAESSSGWEKSSGSVSSSESSSSELSSSEASSLWSSMSSRSSGSSESDSGASSDASSAVLSSMSESSDGSDSSSVISLSSSSGSSGSCEACEEFDWQYQTSGGPLPWDSLAPGQIYLEIQASGTGELDDNGELYAGDCGGENDNIQSGTATAVVTVPPGKVMTFDWTLWGVVESQDGGYDTAWWSLDGVDQARVDSKGDEDGCVPYAPDPDTGSVTLTEGVHTLIVGYDTRDRLYHTDDFGVEFLVENCCIIDAPSP